MAIGPGAMESMGVNPSFWFGKKVLLTGHTGFKGSWLSLWLQSMGARLVGYALEPPTAPSLFEVSRVAGGMVSINGDIRDAAGLQAVFAEFRPEIVFHLAAQSLVRHSYAQPVETYATNVMGTVHVLEAVRNIGGVKAVVNVTSDKSYENREWVWGYRENDALGGHDPYSNSKACAELATAAYRTAYFQPHRYAEHGVALASARAGNVIGGGDWAQDRLVPDILRAVTLGQPLGIRNPRAVRPWQHVLEPLSGYLLLAEKLYAEGAQDFAEAWNFGPLEQDAKAVQWIVETFADLWGGGFRWSADEAERVHEANVLKLDCTKAGARLGWTPRWPVAAALERVVDWHKAYAAGCDMNAFTLAQIGEWQAAQ